MLEQAGMLEQAKTAPPAFPSRTSRATLHNRAQRATRKLRGTDRREFRAGAAFERIPESLDVLAPVPGNHFDCPVVVVGAVITMGRTIVMRNRRRYTDAPTNGLKVALDILKTPDEVDQQLSRAIRQQLGLH